MHIRTLFVLPIIALAACTASVDPVTPPETMNDDQAMEHVTMPPSSGIDADKSSIQFTGKSNIINHNGTFERFSLSITRDATEPEDMTKASLEAVIDITSVKTDSAGLDGHFQKADFFDTVNYPTATFSSRSIVANDDGTYAVNGDLTMKGITHPFTFTGTPVSGGMTLNGEIPRRDFSIANDSYKDKLLEPMVPVTVNVVFAA